jgi:hypothetical protein
MSTDIKTDPIPELSPQDLYHILSIRSHIEHDPQSEVQKVCVCGTFTSLAAAKAAAHRTLFDASYERDWFRVFDAKPDHLAANGDGDEWTHGDGVIVYAVAPGGEIFIVQISTTADSVGVGDGTTVTVKDGRVQKELYYLVQTIIFYDLDASGDKRETSVQGVFDTYAAARRAAETFLIDEEEGLSKREWPQYDELKAGEVEGEYGPNVIVHAIGFNGQNVMLSVLKGQPVEKGEDIMEAAMRIRARANF